MPRKAEIGATRDSHIYRVRVPDELQEQWEAWCARTGTKPADAMRAAMRRIVQGDTDRLDEGAGTLKPIANPLKRDDSAPPALASGGGGLVSTAGDYARYAQMLLNEGEWDGRRILSPQAVRLQMTNHLPDWMMQKGFLIGQQRIRPGFGIGLNGVVFTDPAAAGVPVGRGTYHWDGAAGTWFWADPENDLLFVGMIQLMSQSAPPLQARTQTLMADAIVGPVGV